MNMKPHGLFCLRKDNLGQDTIDKGNETIDNENKTEVEC